MWQARLQVLTILLHSPPCQMFNLIPDINLGKFYYSNAIGASSLRPGGEPLHLDSVMWLASSTKIMTSIAALQCVERGQFTLDEDVTCLLPELKDIEILKGFEPGTQKPILTKATKKITLR